MNIGAVWLLIGVIIITFIVDLIIPQAIAKWALLAPIFIPLFVRLDVAPQTVLAAYRVGDSPFNVITPLMAYFPLIVIFTKRYRKDAGIGTVVSLMLPYVVILSVALDAVLRRLVPDRDPARPRRAREDLAAACAVERRVRNAVSDTTITFVVLVASAPRSSPSARHTSWRCSSSAASPTELLFAIALGLFARAFGADIDLTELLVINISARCSPASSPSPAASASPSSASRSA